jgi:hypothetical protein
MIKSIAICVVLLLNIIEVLGQTTTVSSLKGMWKFRIGDQIQWASPKFDDASWGEIYAPSDWESKGYPGFDGYGWYRKWISIPEHYSEHNLVLELGFIDDVDQVFLNGEKIGQTGSFPPEYSTAYNAKRKYSLPNKLLNFKGENLIAVRVYDSQMEGGITGGEQRIQSTGLTIIPDIDLSGNWELSKGRNFATSSSRNLHVPGSWENQGMQNYDGYAVYRRSFTMNSKLNGQIWVLMAGRIDDLDETYINGQKVGSTGNLTERYTDYHYREFRNYVIPKGVLTPGENTIEIKVYDGHGEGGILEGPVGLITQDRFRDYWRKKRIIAH